jgi:hypothetical protein
VFVGLSMIKTFVLAIFICSGISQECRLFNEKPLYYDNYYECVKDGYGLSFEYLFGEVKAEVIEEEMLFTKWVCKEILTDQS